MLGFHQLDLPRHRVKSLSSEKCVVTVRAGCHKTRQRRSWRDATVSSAFWVSIRKDHSPHGEPGMTTSRSSRCGNREEKSRKEFKYPRMTLTIGSQAFKSLVNAGDFKFSRLQVNACSFSQAPRRTYSNPCPTLTLKKHQVSFLSDFKHLSSSLST